MRIEQRELWEKFYLEDAQVFFPSNFAESVLPWLEKGSKLLDVGCGNGRDSIFFARNGLEVTAIDLSKEAIALLVEREPRMRTVCGNVITSPVFVEGEYSYIYSRFFIHALTEEEETCLLERCYRALKIGGKLLIETRCTEDELCGVGERITDTEWIIDGHYRRFVVPEKIVDKINEIGFRNVCHICSKGFAPFKGSDPVILRITAEK